MHTLNGNIPGVRGTEAAWRSVAMDLRDPWEAAKLRAAGWTLPAEVPDDSFVRVFDTRMDPTWLEELAREIGHGVPEGRLLRIGGDFLTKPFKKDVEALDP